MNYYNYRNSEGRFTRQIPRAQDGKFASPTTVVAGRLYDFRGATVRALQKNNSTGTRLVSFHKTLFGYVKDADLQKIGKGKVKNYLAVA
jgi:hypothetical protein